MNKRIRVNMSIDRMTYAEAREIARRGGYRSVCALCADLLRVAVRLAPSAPEVPPRGITEEITDMFGELSDAEAPRYGERTVQKHNRQRI